MQSWKSADRNSAIMQKTKLMLVGAIYKTREKLRCNPNICNIYYYSAKNTLPVWMIPEGWH